MKGRGPRREGRGGGGGKRRSGKGREQEGEGEPVHLDQRLSRVHVHSYLPSFPAPSSLAPITAGRKYNIVMVSKCHDFTIKENIASSAT